MNMVSTAPVGYWIDREGRCVPESMVKPIDRTRDELVRELVSKASALAKQLEEFKVGAFMDISAFIQLSAEQYGVKVGGTKGNVSLFSFDGRYKVVRQVQEHIIFDERLQAAKQLIDECIQDWATGSRDEIRVLINDAFQVNKEGKINTNRVLGLKRLNIQDEKWLRAMQAIADSVQVAGSKPYIRIYERVGNSEQYAPISLDVAAV
ncbi:MAG: DUF3164 family protein [Proteobacteria bacterium]|nr:DUF3164 family protein [Pseudomonadota bacterium]